jgi:hypothetical protein
MAASDRVPGRPRRGGLPTPLRPRNRKEEKDMKRATRKGLRLGGMAILTILLSQLGAQAAHAEDIPEFGSYGWVYRRSLSNAYTGRISAAPDSLCTGTVWHSVSPGGQSARVKVKMGSANVCWGGYIWIDYLDAKTGAFKTTERPLYHGETADINIGSVGTYLDSDIVICSGQGTQQSTCGEWIITLAAD